MRLRDWATSEPVFDLFSEVLTSPPETVLGVFSLESGFGCSQRVFAGSEALFDSSQALFDSSDVLFATASDFG